MNSSLDNKRNGKEIQRTNILDYFPTSVKELKAFGWDYIDVILVSGDAFVDHPSFGPAVIARVLQNAGYRVAVIPQPNWQDDLRDFRKFGAPRLFFGVSAGNIDSMLNHYTANKRLRSDDAYTPGGQSGHRPDYATKVYCQILKYIYPDTPIVIGGIEASMRRFAHYDYWQDRILSSMLEMSGADILCYGMSEKSIVEVADHINRDGHHYNCFNIRQIAYLSDENDKKKDDIELHSYAEILADKRNYAENFVIVEREANSFTNRRITQQLEHSKLIVNPTYEPLSESEMDNIYALPFTRLPHPRYNGKPDIPAYEMIKNSVTIHRGCFGGCSFCTIAAHQGKQISSRSEKSIIAELERISQMPNFKGHISDIGAPSANMYRMHGNDENLCRKCKRPSCIAPKICPNLNTSHEELCKLYQKALEVKGIKKISIGSGIRYDIALHKTGNAETDRINEEYLELVISKFVSGRLKVAPEHTSPKVLGLMRKTPFDKFGELKALFDRTNKKYGLKQQLIPYFISAHPGCKEEDMAELMAQISDLGICPEQVQTFTPTPMTLSTVMYYTELNPYTMEKVYVPKSREERENQNMYFFWYTPDARKKIEKRLQQLGRNDILKKMKGNKNNNSHPKRITTNG